MSKSDAIVFVCNAEREIKTAKFQIETSSSGSVIRKLEGIIISIQNAIDELEE